jgi:hypothetical protein
METYQEMIPPEIKEKAVKWLQTPYNRRDPKTKIGLCRKLHIGKDTLISWEKELGNGYNVDNVIDELADMDIDAFQRRVYERTKDPSCPAKVLELQAKMFGLLVDKSETKVNIGFNAEDIARIRNEAKRELESEGFTVEGSGEVRPQPALLSEKIRED